MSPLKQEWDDANGKLIRICRVCKKEFSPQRWNQTICTDNFCKEGSKLLSHFQASKKRWDAWMKEALNRGYQFGGGE